jgi:hypothetical protein
MGRPIGPPLQGLLPHAIRLHLGRVAPPLPPLRCPASILLPLPPFWLAPSDLARRRPAICG